MSEAVDLGRLAAEAVPAAVLGRIRAAREVLAVGHENPDADALGAALAVARIVEAGGGRATVAVSDPPPPLYEFLPGIESVRTDPEPGCDYDLLVVVDCATDERIGDLAARHAELFARLPRIVIDHHVSSSRTAETDWIDPAGAATCELVTLLAVAAGVPLDAADGALATPLMAGIVMDTATFAHPNATPRTLAVSAALVAAGAPLADISRRLYRSKPDAQLRLYGRVLARLREAAAGRVVWSTLSLADLDETGALPAHSEGIIDLLAQSETAEVAMLLKEQPDGTTRLSVRTKPGGVDATALTGAFGGGGHARAAGATIARPVDAATTTVLEVAGPLAAAVRR
jgi:bifunctional oligoribonuclease and PAP phosphatase NrnA